ncbi:MULTISPECIES: UDP-glucose 4-epimerase GalE [unclassified Chelatococcus]|uniref:UDP-glucose 4-epimerase GalE n=1 Tax=unclassified Chelatococcus TaxID=2638111 RepID=UPI0002E43983|nr:MULTISPECIES: UDP-glucose 4-epimerase GalE [unclassified Chelatococcus]ALA19937.1 UDP-glucose 4-epimerase [Chelatococcus sp. CO-6]
MTVLVTGGAGYIGSHMVLALRDAGREVVVLDNLSTGFRWAVHPEAAFVEGDCGDEALLGKVIREHGVDAIVHFAGSIVVPDSVADPLGYYLNNTVRSRALIAAAVANGVPRFLFSSTAAVYGDAKESPIVETAPLDPVSPYGTSKLMTEMMLRDTARAHPLKYVALRYFNVAGADPAGRSGQSSPRATHLIKVATQAALGERTHLDVFGTDYPTPDGTCLRDYIHVSDLARAHVLALDHLAAGGESAVFNCGYGRGYSVLEVIEAVKRVSGVDFPVNHAPRRAGDPAALVAGAGRIRETLGWKPELDDLDTIVAHALAWERNLAARRQAAE